MPLVQKDYYLSSKALELIEKALPDEYSDHNLLEVLRNGLKAWVLDEKTKQRVLIPSELWRQYDQEETPGPYEPKVRFAFSADRALLTVRCDKDLLGSTSYSGELQIDKEGLDALLAKLSDAELPNKTTTNVPGRCRGRKKGSGSLAAKDLPLLQEIDRLMMDGAEPSSWAAALKLADKAAGAGTAESKAKRLHAGYRRWKREKEA